MSLSDQERERIALSVWGAGSRTRSPLLPILLSEIDQIVARHVAAALMDAAERVAEFDWDDNFHAGEFGEDGGPIRAGYYSAIERACLLLGGQINDWRDRKPQIRN